MACAAALARSAGPAGEEAGDLVGGVPLEGVGADVVAGQGGFRAGVAQQALDVAQRNALVEPDRADGAPERVRPDRPADPGDLRGAGDVAVHRAAVHASAGAGAQQRPLGRPSWPPAPRAEPATAPARRAGLSPLPTKLNVTYPRTVARDCTVRPAISLARNPSMPPRTAMACWDGPKARAAVRKAAYYHREDLAVLQLAEHLRPRNARAGVD